MINVFLSDLERLNKTLGSRFKSSKFKVNTQTAEMEIEL